MPGPSRRARRPSAGQEVIVFNAHRRYRIQKKIIDAYITKILGRRKAHISIVFTDSHRCKSINRTFLGHNFVTDVVSFRLEEKPSLEGEIYVNLDRAKQQAREFGVSFKNEVARLVIHGTLHLIGYDDMRMADAREMKAVEEAYVTYWFSPKNKKENT